MAHSVIVTNKQDPMCPVQAGMTLGAHGVKADLGQCLVLMGVPSLSYGIVVDLGASSKPLAAL